MSDESTPAAFEPYEITVNGQLLTVLDPEGVPGYRVRMPSGEVQVFAAASGEPSPANAAADIAAALPSSASILIAAKLAARNTAKARRSALIADGFTYSGKIIQTRDQVDIDNIANAALRATNDSGFTTGWITADNSILDLDAAGVIAMQAAMVERGNAIFTAYAALTAQIEAAPNLTALAALPALNV